MTAVYEARDASGRVLYVGMTDDLVRRQRKHASSSPWFARVASWRVAEFPDRATASAEERRRIGSLRPEFNVHHNYPARTVLGMPRVITSRERKAWSLRMLMAEKATA